MLERISEIIAEQMGIEANTINEDTNLVDDLGADSLDIVELVMHFEEEYGVELPTDDLGNIETVKDIMDLMKKMGVE